MRLGSGTTDLATLRDPLLSPQTYDGCTDVPLRSGSTATVDIESRKVVAYQLGGADTTPRGVSATATLDDAAAAYPEGRQLGEEGYRISEHQILAHLPDGSNVRVMHNTDYDRYTRVWLQGERCGDVGPIYRNDEGILNLLIPRRQADGSGWTQDRPGRDARDGSWCMGSDASASSADTAEDEEGERDDGQDHENGPQHCETPSS